MNIYCWIFRRPSVGRTGVVWEKPSGVGRSDERSSCPSTAPATIQQDCTRFTLRTNAFRSEFFATDEPADGRYLYHRLEPVPSKVSGEQLFCPVVFIMFIRLLIRLYQGQAKLISGMSATNPRDPYIQEHIHPFFLRIIVQSIRPIKFRPISLFRGQATDFQVAGTVTSLNVKPK